MTNAEKILALLLKSPGLDDDELSSHTNIHPRQQVYQICKRLESNGQLTRIRGPRGKLVNYLANTTPQHTKSVAEVEAVHRQSNNSFIHKTTKASVGKHAFNSNALDTINSLDMRKTLVMIPCSGKKTVGSKNKSGGPSILDSLSNSLKGQLKLARSKVAKKSHLDESTLLPAWARYDGTLYKIARSALEVAVNNGRNIVIISGGYGLLLVNEPIGHYDQVFKHSNWPKGLLESVLLNHIRTNSIENVVAIVSSSTAYRTLLDRVNWPESSLKNVFLVTPQSSAGAMVKAPRAQGEAMSALLNGALSSAFLSSDGLRMEVQNKMGN